jgi:hypothetical protein
MRGSSREEWEHSIPAVEELRYSVTFRALREISIRDPEIGALLSSRPHLVRASTSCFEIPKT